MLSWALFHTIRQIAATLVLELGTHRRINTSRSALLGTFEAGEHLGITPLLHFFYGHSILQSSQHHAGVQRRAMEASGSIAPLYLAREVDVSRLGLAV